MASLEALKAERALPAAERSPPAAGSPREAGKEENPELRRAAQEFEGVFLRMLLATMLPDDGGGLFGEGPGAGIVRGMFVDQVGASLSQRRALGVADLIERDLARELAPEGGRPQPLEGGGAPVDLRG
jgi:Rod binding domain-containing protein